MNTLFNKIYTYIQEKNLIPDTSTLILGLSGGPDSVFLLHVLAALRQEKNFTIIAAHLNHEWRAESLYDEQVSQELCQQLGITFISKKMSELHLNIKFNGSKEEIGRKARRTFFESMAKEYHAHAIALAHHADDQQETFFIRLMRGASLAGLAGMKAKDGLYIRPLLNIKKVEILEYLHEHNIAYAIDTSNESADYLRNRIRRSVIPALRAADERFDMNFETTHEQLQQAEDFLQELAKEAFKQIIFSKNYASARGELVEPHERQKCLHPSTGSQPSHKASADTAGRTGPTNCCFLIDTQKLLALHPVLRSRVMILWLCAAKVPFIPSQGLFDEMVRFLEKSGSGNHTFYGKWQVLKSNKSATICAKQIDCL